MPLYKDINGETQIAHFGIGDIAITKGQNRDMPYQNEILLIQVPESHNVNEHIPQEYWDKNFAGRSSENTQIPIRLIFEQPESIDAFISELQELKEIIVANQPEVLTVGDALAAISESVLPEQDLELKFTNWLAQATKTDGGLEAALDKLGLDVPEGDGYFHRMKAAVMEKI